MAFRKDIHLWSVQSSVVGTIGLTQIRQLKYYGKGHLVNAFMEEPAERKLRGVEAVMNSFPESKFILVGDSGEQESVHVPCSCIAVLTPSFPHNEQPRALRGRRKSSAAAGSGGRHPGRQHGCRQESHDSVSETHNVRGRLYRPE